MRQLVTIGDLHRGRGRRRYDALRGAPPLAGMGATKTNFAPLTQAAYDAGTPGPALVTATVHMLEHFKADGVPSMHTSDPYVLAFQKAYNADALSEATEEQIAMNAGKLDEDGNYGPNAHDVAVVLASHTPELQPVPNVVGFSTPAKPAATTPTAVTTTTTGKSVWPWVALAAAAAAIYLVMHKRKRARARSKASTTMVFT